MELTNWLSNRQHARDARNMQVSVKRKMNEREIARRLNWFERFFFSLAQLIAHSESSPAKAKQWTTQNMFRSIRNCSGALFSACVNYSKFLDFLIALRLSLSLLPVPSSHFSVPPSLLLLLMSHYRFLPRFLPCSWFFVVYFLCFSFLSIKFHFSCAGPNETEPKTA